VKGEGGYLPSSVFIDRLQRCIKSGPDGRSEIDLDGIVAAVAIDPAEAREYVDFACSQALAAPGFLEPAGLVAEAYRRVTGDDSLVGVVSERAWVVRTSGDTERPLRGEHS
jgi:hypothetical protein